MKVGVRSRFQNLRLLPKWCSRKWMDLWRTWSSHARGRIGISLPALCRGRVWIFRFASSLQFGRIGVGGGTVCIIFRLDAGSRLATRLAPGGFFCRVDISQNTNRIDRDT